MPFASKSQLRTCFSKRPKGWDCDRWLEETKSVCALPERVGGTKSRYLKVAERVVGEVKTGAKGGRYFEIKEEGRKGEICTVKVYIPKSREAPAKPAKKAPAKPSKTAPAKSSKKAPAKPAKKAPAKPSKTAPAKPSKTAAKRAPAKPAKTAAKKAPKKKTLKE